MPVLAEDVDEGGHERDERDAKEAADDISSQVDHRYELFKSLLGADDGKGPDETMNSFQICRSWLRTSPLTAFVKSIA